MKTNTTSNINSATYTGGTSSKEYKQQQLSELANRNNNKKEQTISERISNLLSEIKLQPKDGHWKLCEGVSLKRVIEYSQAANGFFNNPKLANNYYVLTYSGTEYYLICFGVAYKLEMI